LEEGNDEPPQKIEPTITTATTTIEDVTGNIGGIGADVGPVSSISSPTVWSTSTFTGIDSTEYTLPSIPNLIVDGGDDLVLTSTDNISTTEYIVEPIVDMLTMMTILMIRWWWWWWCHRLLLTNTATTTGGTTPPTNTTTKPTTT